MWLVFTGILTTFLSLTYVIVLILYTKHARLQHGSEETQQESYDLEEAIQVATTIREQLLQIRSQGNQQQWANNV